MFCKIYENFHNFAFVLMSESTNSLFWNSMFYLYSLAISTSFSRHLQRNLATYWTYPRDRQQKKVTCSFLSRERDRHWVVCVWWGRVQQWVSTAADSCCWLSVWVKIWHVDLNCRNHSIALLCAEILLFCLFHVVVLKAMQNSIFEVTASQYVLLKGRSSMLLFLVW